MLQGSESCDMTVLFRLHWVISTGSPSSVSMQDTCLCRVPPPQGALHSPGAPISRLYLGSAACMSSQIWWPCALQMSPFYLPEASLLTVWLPVEKSLKGLLAHEAVSGTSPCPRQSWSAYLPTRIQPTHKRCHRAHR